MNKDNNPSCPGCSRKMVYAVLNSHDKTGVKSNPEASVWYCDPETGGCATTMQRILGRRR